MDQITKPPAVKPVKPKTPQLELGTGADSREASMQAAAPHIDANGAVYQADLAKVESLAIADRAGDMEDEEFNWNTDDSIIVKEQRATAVYHNRLGELIVRLLVALRPGFGSFGLSPNRLFAAESAVNRTFIWLKLLADYGGRQR